MRTWAQVGTFISDICLEDGDLLDVDVCLRTEVDEARRTDAERIEKLEQALGEAISRVHEAEFNYHDNTDHRDSGEGWEGCPAPECVRIRALLRRS